MLQRKQILKENFEKLQNLSELLNILFPKLYEVQLEHRKRKEKLQDKQKKLFADKTLSEDEQSVLLSELEMKNKEMDNSYNSTYFSLQGQIKVFKKSKIIAE